MKTKLFFLILLFLIQFGCKEEKKPEIINLSDNSYMSERDFGWHFLPNMKLTNKDEQKKLYNSIDKKIKAEGLNIPPNDRYQFMLYVNEKGKFDKIIILSGKEERVAKIVIDELLKVFDKPVYKDSLPVKFQIPFYYWTNFLGNLEPGSDIDSPPSPIGGMYEIQKNIHYPEIAKRAGIEGTVYIRVDIDENGNVTNTNVLQGIGSGCDEAAINAIKNVKFKPAIRDSLAVKYAITIPVKFKLQ